MKTTCSYDTSLGRKMSGDSYRLIRNTRLQEEES